MHHSCYMKKMYDTDLQHVMPCPWGDGFVQFAYIMWMLWILEYRWLIHVNLLSNKTLKENIVNIKLVHFPFVSQSNNKDGFYCLRPNHWCESFMEIYSMRLSKAFCNNASFIVSKRAINVSFDAKEPFASHNTSFFWRWDKGPCSISY